MRTHESKCLCMDGIHNHGHDEQVDDVFDFECGSVKSVGDLELYALVCVHAIHFLFNAAEKYRHKCIDADALYNCSLAMS